MSRPGGTGAAVRDGATSGATAAARPASSARPALTYRQRVGRLGEATAARYLQQQGYAMVGRNVRVPGGEIDLLARDGQTLVFVEVRTRSGDTLGTPEESVTARKAEKMVACAAAYLLEHPQAGDDWRVDLIAVQLERGRVVRLEHYQHVIQ